MKNSNKPEMITTNTADLVRGTIKGVGSCNLTIWKHIRLSALAPWQTKHLLNDCELVLRGAGQATYHLQSGVLMP